MSQILIRNISRETSEKLKARAKSHGRSLQAEVKMILEEAAAKEDMETAITRVEEIYEAYKTSGRTFDDSTELIRKDRDR